MSQPVLDETTREAVEAATLRRLLNHLMQARPEVQNIDMMNLAGFCRNCLSRWYEEEANARGVALSKDEARAEIYGMPYDDWRKLHQKEASPEQLAAFKEASAAHQ